jgi:hypothetical protein
MNGSRFLILLIGNSDWSKQLQVLDCRLID